MTRVLIETFGCKLNQAESEILWRNLSVAGYRMVDWPSAADVMIINTCTVTHVADRKARQAVRAALKANSSLSVVITGCYAEREAQELSAIPGVTAVIGNSAKADMATELSRLGIMPDTESIHTNNPRTRSLIKIQDGCDHNCAYCIVPLVRPVKSCAPARTVIEEITRRQAEGYREVVLTGTEIGEYQDNGLDLIGLLRCVLEETSIERIRVSSLQPREITPALLELWQDRRLCRHFHLSLQSGSDAVLRRMRRRYTTADYSRAVNLIRSTIPHAAVTTDIIAGFPGETETEFTKSLVFIKQTAFARLHIFPFSPRPNTAAILMPGQVDSQIIQNRVKQLLKIGKQCETEFRQRFEGLTLDVLFEEQDDEEWMGYTDNYIRVTTHCQDSLANQIIPVKL